MLSLLIVYVKNTKKDFVKVKFLYPCIKPLAESVTIYPPPLGWIVYFCTGKLIR